MQLGQVPRHLLLDALLDLRPQRCPLPRPSPGCPPRVALGVGLVCALRPVGAMRGDFRPALARFGEDFEEVVVREVRLSNLDLLLVVDHKFLRLVLVQFPLALGALLLPARVGPPRVPLAADLRWLLVDVLGGTVVESSVMEATRGGQFVEADHGHALRQIARSQNRALFPASRPRTLQSVDFVGQADQSFAAWVIFRQHRGILGLRNLLVRLLLLRVRNFIDDHGHFL